MSSVLFHFVGGDAFFSGFISVAAGAFLIGMTQGKRHRIGAVLILIGWLFVITSATPLPSFQYICLALISLRILIGNRPGTTSESTESESETKQPSKPEFSPARWCPTLCFLAIGTMCFEFLHHHSVAADVPAQSPVFVIGDSLSAGINDGVDIPWPQRLAEITSLKVSNLAKAGATCRSAVSQLEGLPKQCTVLVEIGGNDLLSGRSTSDFETDLDDLLKTLQTPDRQVVMFELPLPPLCNGYGYAQRKLTARYNIPLIPRRVLASVLFSENATLDSIHLSNKGHQQLAEHVAKALLLK